MAGYSNRTWICPFFKWDEKQRVHCEGGTITMPDKQAYKAYIDQYCSSCGWGGCSMSATLMDYYERQDAEEKGR